jgi:DNA-binding response OmpR family regulator
MKLLIIDDDDDLLESLVRLFTDRGHDVVGAANGILARDAVANGGDFDVVICDFDFGKADTRNGVEICYELRPLCAASTHFIINSGLNREIPSWMHFSSKGDILEMIDMVESFA